MNVVVLLNEIEKLADTVFGRRPGRLQGVVVAGVGTVVALDGDAARLATAGNDASPALADESRLRAHSTCPDSISGTTCKTS